MLAYGVAPGVDMASGGLEDLRSPRGQDVSRWSRVS